jgi:ATP-dependent DNA helicase RecQ
MREFLGTSSCLMEFLIRELDDPDAHPCGRCANCAGPFVPSGAPEALTREATEFLERSYLDLEPRKQWAAGKKTSETQRAEPGRALCYYGDAAQGSAVRRGKYDDQRFAGELVWAVADLVRNTWRPQPRRSGSRLSPRSVVHSWRRSSRRA